MSIRVVFSHGDEFLEDLEACKPGEVEGNIVRVTQRREGTSFAPLSHLFVIGGFVVNGHLVQLKEFCGQLLGGQTPEEDRVVARARSIGTAIEKRCQELGYETRSGAFENVKE